LTVLKILATGGIAAAFVLQGKEIHSPILHVEIWKQALTDRFYRLSL